MLHRPHAKVDDIRGLSRLVTLPDYQGMGLAMILSDKLGAAYRALGLRMHTYPAHPALIRSFDKSPCWVMHKKPGQYSPLQGKTSTLGSDKWAKGMGSRPCAVFEYVGPKHPNADEARALIEGHGQNVAA